MAKKKRSAELDEIWSLFAQEGKENLASAEEALLKLERDPGDMEQIKVLFRAVHSFKGGARMMGLGVVESLAHRAEDLIALVRDDGVTLQSDMIDLLLKVLDRLRGMLDQVLAEGHDVEPEQAASLTESLQHMIAQRAPAAERTPTQDAPTPTLEGSQVAAPTAEPISAPVELIGEEISPAADPASVKADLAAPADPTQLAEFLKRTEGDLAQLHAALDAFAASAPDALAQIQAVAKNLQVAAERMGYQRLVSILDDLDRVTRADAPTDAAAT
jgi:two-component system chemotaxis sensor kinase CheA